METETKDFNTYISVAQKLIAENPDFYTQEAQDGIMSFAKYLDSFKTIGMEMQILAHQMVNKIDREFITELLKEITPERAKEIAELVNSRHIHKK